MKIYTKTGDQGETGLFFGGRVPKSDPRCEAYGEADSVVSVSALEDTSEEVDVEPDPDESAVSFGVVEQAAKKNTKSALVNNFITI